MSMTKNGSAGDDSTTTSGFESSFNKLSLGGALDQDTTSRTRSVSPQHQSSSQYGADSANASPRRRGVVKFFNSLKGFGFVVDNDPGALGGQEVFVHFSAIGGKGGFRSLAEGEEVEYELVQGPKGFQAANLTGPGGRNVVGDPKIRLTKPMPYMPFGHMPMMPASFMADPYIQHPAMFTGAQHVVYVPTTMAMPPTQPYPYMPQTMTAPPASNGLAQQSSSGDKNATNQSGYAPVPATRFGSMPPPPPSVASNNPSSYLFNGRGSASNSSAPFSSLNTSYGGLSTPHSPPSQPLTFGFSPFSPPALPHAPLYGNTPPPALHPPSLHSPPSRSSALPSASIRSSSAASNGEVNTSRGALFGNGADGSSSQNASGDGSTTDWQSSILYSSGDRS